MIDDFKGQQIILIESPLVTKRNSGCDQGAGRFKVLNCPRIVCSKGVSISDMLDLYIVSAPFNPAFEVGVCVMWYKAVQ